MSAFINRYIILILFKDNTTKNTVAIATVFLFVIYTRLITE
jgi:hypothetical protein